MRSALLDRLDKFKIRLRYRLDKLNVRLGSIDTRLEVINENLDKINNELDEINEKLRRGQVEQLWTTPETLAMAHQSA